MNNKERKLKLNRKLNILSIICILIQFIIFLITKDIFKLFLTLLMICSVLQLIIPKKILDNSKVNIEIIRLIQLISIFMLICFILFVFFSLVNL